MAEGHRHSVRAFFDRNAQSWRDRYGRSDFDAIAYQDRMGEALRLLTKHGKQRGLVLDAGCGAGVQAKAMADAGYRVLACDLAPAMAASAREHIGPRVAVASAEQLPFADRSLDAVVMLGVIGYSTAPWKVVASARRVLRHDGIFVVSTANNRLLLERLSAAASYGPDAVYRGVRRLLDQRSRSAAADGKGFYADHYSYTDARDFDGMIERGGFLRLEGAAVNFGCLRFMDKRLWPEAMDVRLSRALTRAARGMRLLERHARIYIGCYRKLG